ncbi:MAG TPA: cation diffusion facilitator family transporter [Chthonomonadales bacterium]|nr:cation diffusion facilitator family transporter [Chthonomonadales bacterium]
MQSGELAAGALEKRRVALTSMLAAVALTSAKLVVGVYTGSLALLSEAVHSALDLVCSIITYFAVRIADRPADRHHPYGHGKVENLSALIETVLLLCTCVWIVWEALHRLLYRAVNVDASVWAFAVVIVSIIVDRSRSSALMRTARRYNSHALEADAINFRADVLSSCVVLASLALVHVGEVWGRAPWLEKADSVAALVVVGIVVRVSLGMGRRAIDVLLDRAPDGLAAGVEEVVRSVPGVLGCSRVRVRPSGGRTFVDLVIDVERGTAVERSHAIGVAAEERIRDRLPGADIMLHVDPVRVADASIPERILAITTEMGRPVHNIRVYDESAGVFVEQDLEVPEDLSLAQAHELATEVEERITREVPSVRSVITRLEARRSEPRTLSDLDASAAGFDAIVRRLAAETEGIRGVEEARFYRSGQALHLRLVCRFDQALTMREVRTITLALEERLRASVPGLSRITTHPEPA